MVNEHDHDQAPPRGPQPGSPRVQSWIRTVLNPLIEAVEYELQLLGRGSLTWRFHARRSEHLGPIGAYVSDSRRALEDLLRARPKIEPPLVEHDRLLGVAVQQAGRAFDSLISSPDFVTQVNAKLTEFGTGQHRGARPSGAYEPDKMPDLVAERVVNNDDAMVGRRYTDAEFWNTNRAAFMAMAVGPEFEGLRSAIEALRQHDVNLLDQLKDWHFELVEEYDVEPV